MPSVVLLPWADDANDDEDDDINKKKKISNRISNNKMGEPKWVNAEWLWVELRRSSGPGVLVVDCRNLEDYSLARIRGSVHMSLPSLLLRRLAAGKLPVENAIPCGVARDTFLSACGAGRRLVVCGRACDPADCMDAEDRGLGPVASVLLKRLCQDGHEAVALGGSVDGFREEYPDWCETVDDDTKANPKGDAASDSDCGAGNKDWLRDSEPAVVGLQALRLTPGYVKTPDSGYPLSKKSRFSARARESRPKKTPATLKPPRRFGVGSVDSLPDTTEEEDCADEDEDYDGSAMDSSLGSADSGSESGTLSTGGGYTDGPRAAKGFPVQILPYLYLGNALNAEDEDALRQHSIQYILNVTPDLPNVFERRDSSNSGSDGCGDDGNGSSSRTRRLHIKYKKIPIDDHWSQDIGGFLPEAIQFIDEARSKGVGVLVHCLAGVSRSVTFTLAYLMFKLHLSLNDAFDFVRRRKGNIAPNFTFLGQLLEFERQQLPALRARHRELLDDHPESSSLDSTATMSKAVGGGGGGNVPRVRVLAGSCSEDDGVVPGVGMDVDADDTDDDNDNNNEGGEDDGDDAVGVDTSSDTLKAADASSVADVEAVAAVAAVAAAAATAVSPDSGIDFDR